MQSYFNVQPFSEVVYIQSGTSSSNHEVCGTLPLNTKFMQENAATYASHAVKQWFRHWGVAIVDWPPHSPDLNPQEHLWFHLKCDTYKVRSDILDFIEDDTIVNALEKLYLERGDLSRGKYLWRLD